MPKNPDFSNDDFDRAHRALRVYRVEILGRTGLVEAVRYHAYAHEGPRQYATLQRRGHFQELPVFRDRIASIGVLAADLGYFVDKPLSLPHRRSDELHFVSRREIWTITDHHVASYNGFAGALGEYADHLEEHGPEAYEAEAAQRRAGLLIDPVGRKHSQHIPVDAISLTNNGTEEYLVGVLNIASRTAWRPPQA